MQVTSNTCWGAEVSTPRVIVSTLPVVGLIMGFVNLRHLWCPCCCESPAKKIEKKVKEIETDALQLSITPVPANPEEREELKKKIEEGKNKIAQTGGEILKAQKKDRLFAATGMASSLLTLAAVVTLVALAIFTGPLAGLVLVLTTIWFVTYGIVCYMNHNAVQQSQKSLN